MRSFRFRKIDAFASGRSAGNPAAAVYLDSFDDITPEEMQRIARELKGFVSEVGYIAPAGTNRYRLRYFSSEKEVQFCGHATIAILYDLLKEQEGPAANRKVLLETNKGLLTVEDRIADEDSVFITAPAPRYLDRPIETSEICNALNLKNHALDPQVPIGIVNAGNETLCVPLRTLEDLLSLSPEYGTLRTFCAEQGLDVVIVHTADVADRSRFRRTRVFAAPFGYLEDPATGSGNAALGYHLLRHGLWDGRPIVLEQNNDRMNPNIVRMVARTDEQGNIRVLFGGGAITRIDGRYLLGDAKL